MWEAPMLQAVLWEGRHEGVIEGRIDVARRFLLRQGTKRFGEPDAATPAALEAIQDIYRLEALGVRILDHELLSWDGLLCAS
jgi:hypothetical protein